MFSLFFNELIAVNELLEKWAIDNLYCKSVLYLPNFVSFNTEAKKVTPLKGQLGKRIVCLANLRPQKDHINLLKAFIQVNQKHPDWTLHLVGKYFNDEYTKNIKLFIKKNHLEYSVFLYGSCPDVDVVLQQW